MWPFHDLVHITIHPIGTNTLQVLSLYKSYMAVISSHSSMGLNLGLINLS